MRADGVFSGGGIKGLAFAGGLQAAAEAGYDEWGKLAGTSAGSITAMALAVGYTAQGLREQLDSFDLGKIADYGPLGEAEFPIAEAVRISAGFPYFFPPLSLRDARTKKPGVLVDGGVTSAFPIFLFDKAEPRHPTWGFRLYAGSGPEKPSYTVIDGPLWPVDMLKAIVDTSMHALDNLEMIAFRPRTISIPTGDIPTLDFSLTDAQKKELFDSGYNTAKAFFEAKPDGRNTFGAMPASLQSGP